MWTMPWLALALVACGSEPEVDERERIEGSRTGVLITVKEHEKPARISLQDGQTSQIWNFVCAPDPCYRVTPDDIGRPVRVDFQVEDANAPFAHVRKLTFLD